MSLNENEDAFKTIDSESVLSHFEKVDELAIQPMSEITALEDK